MVYIALESQWAGLRARSRPVQLGTESRVRRRRPFWSERCLRVSHLSAGQALLVPRLVQQLCSLAKRQECRKTADGCWSEFPHSSGPLGQFKGSSVQSHWRVLQTHTFWTWDRNHLPVSNSAQIPEPSPSNVSTPVFPVDDYILGVNEVILVEIKWHGWGRWGGQKVCNITLCMAASQAEAVFLSSVASMRSCCRSWEPAAL